MGKEVMRTNDDGFAVEEHRGGFIVGAMIKFNDRVFTVDKTEMLPEDTRLVALGVTTAWVRWENGQPVEHRVTALGEAHPERQDMVPELLDKSKWELGPGDQPADPWKDTRYLRLVDPRSGKDYTFVTDTTGGRIAVGNLKSQIRNVRFAHPNGVPVVELRWCPMKTRFGTRPRPVFEVVGWRGGSGTGGPAPVVPQIQGPSSNKIGISTKPEEATAGMDDEIPF